jgi:hypothetical protein
MIHDSSKHEYVVSLKAVFTLGWVLYQGLHNSSKAKLLLKFPVLSLQFSELLSILLILT